MTYLTPNDEVRLLSAGGVDLGVSTVVSDEYTSISFKIIRFTKYELQMSDRSPI